MNAGTDQGPVLVTGGSGYLAGFVVVQLLNAGRMVRTTVRDLARADAVRATLQPHAPTDRLSFHAANLLSGAGWDAAVDGAEGVIHVASPMPIREYRTQDLEKPAREGVGRVLEASRRAGLGRVVVTSPTVAAEREAGDAPSDATTWTNLSGKGVTAYARSKTLAEQDAWALAASFGETLSLTTVLPGGGDGPGARAGGVRLAGAAPAHADRPPAPCAAPHLQRRGHARRGRAARQGAGRPARGERILAAGAPRSMREQAEMLKARLGAKASRVWTRDAPDWLIRTLGLVSFQARFVAAGLGKRRHDDSHLAEAVLDRPLRSLADATADAGESLVALGRA